MVLASRSSFIVLDRIGMRRARLGRTADVITVYAKTPVYGSEAAPECVTIHHRAAQETI